MEITRKQYIELINEVEDNDVDTFDVSDMIADMREQGNNCLSYSIGFDRYRGIEYEEKIFIVLQNNKKPIFFYEVHQNRDVFDTLEEFERVIDYEIKEAEQTERNEMGFYEFCPSDYPPLSI